MSNDADEDDELLKLAIIKEVQIVLEKSDIEIVTARNVREAVEDRLKLTRGYLKQSHLKQPFKNAIEAAFGGVSAGSGRAHASPKLVESGEAPSSRATVKPVTVLSGRNISRAKESEETVNDESEDDDPQDLKPTKSLPAKFRPTIPTIASTGGKRNRVISDDSEILESAEQPSEEPIKVAKKDTTNSSILTHRQEDEVEITRLKTLVRQCGVHKQV